MRRVLVTGAAGFVGQWLLPALEQTGASVFALATEPPTAAMRTAHQAAWLIGDLRDDAYVAGVLDAALPDTVIHLAAISHVPTAEADPATTWDINVTATARLLRHTERVRAAGLIDPTVLVVGSAEQYGRHEQMPLHEAMVQQPRTVYAATKAAQELLALQRWRATGLQVVVARSFNHSGPGQAPRFLLPALVQRAVLARTASPGTLFPIGNRTPVRDFLHVSDVVAAYIALCQRGAPGEAYNVASGNGWSVQALVERVLARAQVQAVPTEDPALVRPVDVPALVGDSHKLQRATGWRALRSLDDIIDDLFHASTF